MGSCFSRFFFVSLYYKIIIINPLALFYYVFVFIFFKCYSLCPCCACFGSCILWLSSCSLSVGSVHLPCFHRHVFLFPGLCAPLVLVSLPPLSVLCLHLRGVFFYGLCVLRVCPRPLFYSPRWPPLLGAAAVGAITAQYILFIYYYYNCKYEVLFA